MLSLAMRGPWRFSRGPRPTVDRWIDAPVEVV
jgi:hypothetical protein